VIPITKGQFQVWCISEIRQRGKKRRREEFHVALLRDFSQAQSGNSRKSFSPLEFFIQRKQVSLSTALLFAGSAIARRLWGIPKKESSVTRQIDCLVPYKPH
jgi:hypothetical protein